jgi:signal transduction histidine kinase
MNRQRQFSGVTGLAAAVLVLLPALAWLQYSWLEQIADADRERRARTLQTAATQLTQDFDAEIGRAVFALQLDPAAVEQNNWAGFAQKYQVWAEGALSPRIVKSIYFVPAPDGPATTAPTLRQWNPQTHTFDDTPWPKELTPVRARFTAESVSVIDVHGLNKREGSGGPREGTRERRSVQRLMIPPTPTGDDQSIVTPVMRITTVPATTEHPRPSPDIKLLGFSIVRLDIEALGRDVLPPLVRKHFFDHEGDSEYAIAVVARDDRAKVIYESEPAAAAAAASQPDATASLLGPRMGQFLFMARAGEGRRDPLRPGPPPPPRPGDGDVVVNVIEEQREGGTTVQRTAFAGDGQWHLLAKHRAGSLEAAVASARTRNFALSSGILALLAAAVGLIIVSARRADRLARQQLEFVAAVSHELRTPVSVIGAAAGNLADGVVDEPARVKRYGATIQTEARRLGETVERVLQLAGIAAGRAAATPMIVPGHVLISDALTAVAHHADTAGVSIERHLPDALPSVRGDAMALRSALQNLIGNAVKYSGDARWVRISASATARTLRVTVEDRGIGIDQNDRRHIFEPFYRGQEAVTRQIQGSGLGLHLVRRIVEAHGGSVSVQSEVGKGSTFVLELPVASEPPSGAHEGAPAEARL